MAILEKKVKLRRKVLHHYYRDFSNVLHVQYLRLIAEWKAIVTATTTLYVQCSINSDGNSELARIYLRSAWRNSSRSKYDRPASILIRSGGLRASEKFPVETDHAWVPRPRFRSGLPKRWAFASHISAYILVSSVNFFLLSAKYGLRIISMFDLA